MLVHLRQRYTDPALTVDEVARACHISRRTLFRLFGIGRSYHATLRDLQVRHAQRLLARDASRQLAEVAFASGFAAERTFYRAFQRETGMTPGEYRRLTWH